MDVLAEVYGSVCSVRFSCVEARGGMFLRLFLDCLNALQCGCDWLRDFCTARTEQ